MSIFLLETKYFCISESYRLSYYSTAVLMATAFYMKFFCLPLFLAHHPFINKPFCMLYVCKPLKNTLIDAIQLPDYWLARTLNDYNERSLWEKCFHKSPSWFTDSWTKLTGRWNFNWETFSVTDRTKKVDVIWNIWLFKETIKLLKSFCITWHDYT